MLELLGSDSASSLCAALDETVARARSSELYRQRLAGVHIGSLADLARLPLTTRQELQAAGVHGTRAVPLERVCHYQESSGTTGVPNSAWLTAGDLARSARAIRAAHPDIFAPGRIILNRFPFMAAPAHLMQLIAQEGGGVAIPAGNINWDVPFPRALDLAQRLGAHIVAGLPLEPIVLGELARLRGLQPARDLAVDTLFLGGAPLPPALQRVLARMWGARVIELYGSTETMLLGTSCPAGRLHLETELAFCEVLDDQGELIDAGGQGRLIVTTLGIEGSPLVRLDTGDTVRLLADPCRCGSSRPGIVVLGRAADVIQLGGRTLFPYEVIEAAAAAAEALESAVFFVVVLPDRVVVRIEVTNHPRATAAAEAAWRTCLTDVPVEIECTAPCMLLDVENLSRSPQVYKPIVLSDWRRAGRKVVTVSEGMIEWPRPSGAEMRRWLGRLIANGRRRRRLARGAGLARSGPR